MSIQFLKLKVFNEQEIKNILTEELQIENVIESQPEFKHIVFTKVIPPFATKLKKNDKSILNENFETPIIIGGKKETIKLDETEKIYDKNSKSNCLS